MEPYLPRVFANTAHTTTLTVSYPALGTVHHVPSRGFLHRPGDPHAQRLKVVCKACNNGWMSRLQERTKPILVPLLKGEWAPLTKQDQKTLAAWATMFTMVLEFADPNTLVTPPEQRDQFRLTQEPPQGWAVWVGDYEGVLWRGVFNHFGWRVAPVFLRPGTPPAVALDAKFDAQSTAIAPGRLFLMTFSTTYAHVKVNERAFAERFGVRVLWPNADVAVVRPDKVLDDIAADTASAAIMGPRPHTRRAWDAML